MRFPSRLFVITVACSFASVFSLACPMVPACTAGILHFEDVFGPCGDSEIVAGPSTTTIEGVTFTSPDVNSYNCGKEGGMGNPFESDSYHFWTFGTGATIRFPTPIKAMQFAAGVFTDLVVWPTFELVADGEVVATFGANLSTLEFVDVNLPAAPTEVVIRCVGGSSSLLGIDDLTYTPVPTPAERTTWGRVKTRYRDH